MVRQLLGFGLVWLAASPLFAQATIADADDIIVTAERRVASLPEVPISIKALSGDTLEAAGIRTTEQLSDLTPGLLVQRSVVGKISIRGIGNENCTIAGDPGVAVHSDGVYVARPAAGLFDLFDVERVEVLRGPQGTLYGRNATGGVINILPNRPGKPFEARMDAYRDIILPMLRERGAHYPLFELGGAVGVLHGHWQEGILAISRWPDLARAHDFWFSDRYQKVAIPTRTGAGTFDVQLAAGIAG